ncbi:MAG TPA: DUF1385 domain-containing protein, partial [Candidatus Atribacteria bacterium]|nr:DUF1385 domain-containing protein [Candidatus Atribacteria bacterium]
MKKSMIGGQAVLEGVMMKAPEAMAIAVRREDGTIDLTTSKLTPAKHRYPILKLPVLRGIIAFGESMVLGVKSIMTSAEMYGSDEAEQYKPSKFDAFIAQKTGRSLEDVAIFFALVIAIIFVVGMFIVLPALAAGFLRTRISSHVLVNVFEGLVRLTLFLIYIVSISRMKDIKRVFEYHGAEHKTIHCYEHDEELTVENARKYPTLHPRCVTAFLLIVMVISIFIFSFLGWQNIFVRMASRLALLPLVAGLSYEVIRLAGKSDAPLVKAVIYPGLLLQRLTTREPDDKQL